MKIRKTHMNAIEIFFRNQLMRKKISLKTMAAKLFIEEQTLYNALKKPWWNWRIGQLMEYCDAIGAPYTGALKAALQCMKEELRT